MDITNRQVISDVIGELNSLNIDERLSNRFILSRLKDRARVFIKQDLDSRRLFKITSIWKSIKCFEMCETDLLECGCNIPHCKFVMKSKKKLPRAFDSNYGTLIKVFTIGGGKEYVQTTISKYIDIKSREFINPNTRYFWIDDGYLYIPDSKVVEVMVMGLFENPEEVDILNEVDGAECAKPLDALFPCPGHLLDAVKKDTVTLLAKIYKAIPEDEKPNMNSNDK